MNNDSAIERSQIANDIVEYVLSSHRIDFRNLNTDNSDNRSVVALLELGSSIVQQTAIIPIVDVFVLQDFSSSPQHTIGPCGCPTFLARVKIFAEQIVFVRGRKCNVALGEIIENISAFFLHNQLIFLQHRAQCVGFQEFFDFVFVHVHAIIEVATPEHVIMRFQRTALKQS